MTNAGRLKDLADIAELIKVVDLPLEFADQLDPYVQDKFKELWKLSRKRYVTSERGKSAEQLDAMRLDGVSIEMEAGVSRARLVTTDPKIAEKYGMVEESEYWSAEEQDDATGLE